MGNPLLDTHRAIIIGTMALCGIYLLISKKDVKIIRNKVDIFIILLGMSTLIPLIFNTSVSITSEVTYIFKYISAILLYICAREHFINYPDTRKIIINTITGLSILLIIFGIDDVTTKLFTKPLNLINVYITSDIQHRICSTFCYPNALAIIISVSIILNNLNYLSEQNKIKKSIYGVITTFLLMGLLLTYSRIVMLLLAIFLIIYMVLLKDKLKIYDLIKLLIISFIVTFAYNSIYSNLVNAEKYIFMWLATIGVCLLSFAIIYFSINLEKKIVNIKIKKIVIFASIVITIFAIVIFTVRGSLDVFKNNRKEYEIQIGNIEPNSECIMNFEFGEIKVNENAENFVVEVVELDEYREKIDTIEIDESEFLSNKEIKITTQDTTRMLKIVFTRINDNCKVIIDRLTINGKNKTLDFKLLPDGIEHRIENTLMSRQGLYERKVFIEDGLKLVKDNFWFGKGGNAWQYEMYNYQQYFYVANQVHSYILQLNIEYGIVSVISFIIIIFLTVYKYIKSKNKFNLENFTLILAMLLLVIHSLMDFDMVFLYVMQVFFILLAMICSLDTESESQDKELIVMQNKKIRIIYSIIIFALMIGYIILRPYYDSNLKIKEIHELANIDYTNIDFKTYKENNDKIIKKYEEFFKLERHFYIQNVVGYFDYGNIVLMNASNSNISETTEKISYLYDIAQKIQPTYDLETLFIKFEGCVSIADNIKYLGLKDEKLNKLSEEFYMLVLDEAEKTKEKVEKEHGLYKISKSKMEETVKSLESLCNYIKANIE